jgi:hypothetical protein
LKIPDKRSGVFCVGGSAPEAGEHIPQKHVGKQLLLKIHGMGFIELYSNLQKIQIKFLITPIRSHPKLLATGDYEHIANFSDLCWLSLKHKLKR